MGISIVLLLYPLNTILVKRPIRKAQVNQSSRPFFLRIYKSLLYKMQLKAPLISRLSIDTTQPRRACYAAQILEVIRERAKRVNYFFLTPIYVYSSSPYTSTASYSFYYYLFQYLSYYVFKGDQLVASQQGVVLFIYLLKYNYNYFFIVFQYLTFKKVGSYSVYQRYSYYL